MKHYRLTNACLACLLPSALLGCATQSFELRSTPAAAEISTLDGEKLGETPLILSSEQLKKIEAAPGKVALRLSARGHLDRDVILELRGENSYEVKLSPADDTYYSGKWLNDFSKQTNTMVREILQIQGFLITRKISEAEKAIASFEARFPNLAALYVMKGNLELLKGNKDQAHGYFLRAQSIDPEDAVAARLARQTSARKPAGAP